jgi:hypothetical protein
VEPGFNYKGHEQKKVNIHIILFNSYVIVTYILIKTKLYMYQLKISVATGSKIIGFDNFISTN